MRTLTLVGSAFILLATFVVACGSSTLEKDPDAAMSVGGAIRTGGTVAPVGTGGVPAPKDAGATGGAMSVDAPVVATCAGTNPKRTCKMAADECVPSTCVCNESSREWVCSNDCQQFLPFCGGYGGVTASGGTIATDGSFASGGRISEVDAKPVDAPAFDAPVGKTCTLPNPARGCLPAPGACVPSSCGCDPSTGTWVCTADCRTSLSLCPDAGAPDTEDADAGVACTVDADCQLLSDYCGGCNCLVLAAKQTGPVCKGSIVSCFADPCMNKAARCVNLRCTAGTH